jgi:hypothetical protein
MVMTKFAIIVTGSEVKSSSNSILSEEGQQYWVVIEREGWVEATSRHYQRAVPQDIKLFDSEDDAKAFADRWEGHPWWCKPKSYTVVKLQERYEHIMTGYEVVETA